MKKYSKLLIVLAAIFCIIGCILLFVSHLFEYAIFVFTLGAICLLTGIISIVRYRNPNVAYQSRVNAILNTFDSILVRSSSVPNLEGRNIVLVMSMDDLVDAQLEIRKPICYLKQTESCSFVLLDDKEAYIYVEKVKENVQAPIEIAIDEIKIKNKSREEMDSEMLRDIDNTTIVKLSNQKSYRVSPIRKKKKEIELLDQTQTIPNLKKKKSLFDRTQVIEQLEDTQSFANGIDTSDLEVI